MEVQLMTVLVSVLLCGPLIRPILGYCPTQSAEIVNALRSCLHRFFSLAEFSEGPITARQLNNYCNSIARSAEIQCAANLIDECKQQSDENHRIIKKTLNMNAIKTVVNLWCDNVELLVGKQECIARYESTVAACIDTKIYEAKMEVLQQEGQAEGESSEWLEEKYFEELCHLSAETSDCRSPYRQNCGDKIGDIYHALGRAITPPACAGVMEQASSVLLIFLAGFAVIKGSH